MLAFSFGRFNNSFIFARGRLEQAVVVVRDAVRAADGLVVADAVVVAIGWKKIRDKKRQQFLVALQSAFLRDLFRKLFCNNIFYLTTFKISRPSSFYFVSNFAE